MGSISGSGSGFGSGSGPGSGGTIVPGFSGSLTGSQEVKLKERAAIIKHNFGISFINI